MAGVNKAIIIGHLGGDPDIRRTQAGHPVASFSVATSEQWRDKTTGERKESTDWHRVVIFSEPLCQVAEQYLKKGAKVYIEGQMKTRKWVDQGGVDRYVTEVVLKAFHSQLVLLDRREVVPAASDESSYGTTRSSDGAGSGDGANAAGCTPRNSGNISSGRPSRVNGAGAAHGDIDDDIPF